METISLILKKTLDTILWFFQNGYFQIIVSSFAGGFFAAWFTNIYESKRRVADKRTDKYYEHRNTIVQIEHEILPTRVNIARNIESIRGSLENTNKFQKRIVLRFFKLQLSKGLSIYLLNLDLINLYSEVFSLFESINNDIDYLNQVIGAIKENRTGVPDFSLIELYFQFSRFLLLELETADKKSLELVTFCKLVINKSDKEVLARYIKKNGEIKYNINKKSMEKEFKKIKKEETLPSREGESRPQFIAPYFDLKIEPF